MGVNSAGRGMFLSNLQRQRGGYEILDLLKKLRTFLYAVWLKGLDISQNIQKKSVCRAFAFRRRRYTQRRNRTAHDIPNFGSFWVAKIQGGNASSAPPPDKNIPATYRACLEDKYIVVLRMPVFHEIRVLHQNVNSTPT